MCGLDRSEAWKPERRGTNGPAVEEQRFRPHSQAFYASSQQLCKFEVGAKRENAGRPRACPGCRV
jgi:hypothetical protein